MRIYSKNVWNTGYARDEGADTVRLAPATWSGVGNIGTAIDPTQTMLATVSRSPVGWR